MYIIIGASEFRCRYPPNQYVERLTLKLLRKEAYSSTANFHINGQDEQIDLVYQPTSKDTSANNTPQTASLPLIKCIACPRSLFLERPSCDHRTIIENSCIELEFPEEELLCECFERLAIHRAFCEFSVCGE